MNQIMKKMSQHAASLFMIGLYMYLTVPNFLTSIYAEDGQDHLQDAIRDGGLQTLFRTVGGYADIPTKAIAATIYQSSPELYPVLLGIAVITIIHICSLVIYSSVVPFFQNKSLAILFISFLVISPIARFESIGNVANLHFFIFTSSAFIFLRFIWFKSVTKFQLFFILMSALSTPLVLFYFILILYNFNGNLKEYKQKENLTTNPFFILFIGSILNFTISWGDTSNRPPNNSNSIFEITYLFLDRVVGSAFIPFWGRVSSDGNSVLISHSPFQHIVLRATLASVILILLIISTLKLESELRKFSLFLLGVILIFCFLVGRFYNLEPRYSIFPCFLITFLSFLVFSKFDSRFIRASIAIWLVLLSLNARAESESRQGSTNWGSEVKEARNLCKNQSGLREVPIQISPFNADYKWYLSLSCYQLE